MEANKHIWHFSTVGGVKRVNLERGADLMALDTLDQKLWTALSCPVKGLEIDPKTLELIDADKDGQIRVPEILNAVKWITELLKNPDDLLKQEEKLLLSAINDQTEKGNYLLHCAQIVLNNLGKKNELYLTVEDTSDFIKIFASTAFNGDGVITEDSTTDESLKKVIAEIILCAGSVQDRGGKLGINEEQLNSFFENIELYDTWQKLAESDSSKILPLGSQTEQAYQSLREVQNKIDDYFLRCRLAAYDPQSAIALNQLAARVETIATKDLQASMDEISTFPLSKIEAGKSLELGKGLNPSWEQSLLVFKNEIADKLLKGKEQLSEADWKQIQETFLAFADWKSKKAGEEVEQLGLERIRELSSGGVKKKIQALLAEDKDLEDEANNMILVDQLVRYHRDLFKLLKNFVTFYDFYNPGSKAIFQAGTLYIDQRSCELCIKVNDMGRHDMMVGLSGMYVIYCNCVSKATGEEMKIAVALTNGDIDNMIEGRNAVFYDRNGLDWDATVIKIIDNPISIRQAFWSPYRKVSRFIEKQVNKFAASQDDKVMSQATGSIEKKAVEAEVQAIQAVVAPSPAPTAPAPAPPPAPPFDIGKFVGIFAAIALAMGAIGSVIASVVGGFLALTWWKMPLALAGLMLLISGPSMIMAFLKLRKRNLAPILDANGWAINAAVTVNISFGNTLTSLASLPLNAKVNLNDPFRKKGIPSWQIVLTILLVLGLALYLTVFVFKWVSF